MENWQLKLAFFAITEYEKEQKWLHKQHLKGWKLIHTVLPCFYIFEKCQPEDVIYQLDYNQDSDAHKDEYIKMFSDCGWEYITKMAGYTYFRKPLSQMSDKDEQIFCDNESRIDMMYRVCRGKMIPLIAYLCLMIPLLYVQYYYNEWINKIAFGILLVLFILCVSVLIEFAWEYWKLKRVRKY